MKTVLKTLVIVLAGVVASAHAEDAEMNETVVPTEVTTEVKEVKDSEAPVADQNEEQNAQSELEALLKQLEEPQEEAA